MNAFEQPLPAGVSRGIQVFEEVCERLGTPYYREGLLAIYHGDCMEFMRQLPSELIDLTVTSPPYNIGKEYERRLPLAEYVRWCGAWMSEVHRLTSSEGAFWLNLGYVPVEGAGKAVPLPYLLWDASPFFLLQEVVWHYGAGVAARRVFSPRNEKFLWFVKDESRYTFDLDAVRDPDVKYPNQKKNGKLKCNPLGKNPSDVWVVPKVTSGTRRASPERTAHPAQFPSRVIERVILASSREGDLVLDPFLGSGTTADVALRLGRPVIGFEIDEGYAGIAKARIARAVNSPKLEQLELPSLDSRRQ